MSTFRAVRAALLFLLLSVSVPHLHAGEALQYFSSQGKHRMPPEQWNALHSRNDELGPAEYGLILVFAFLLYEAFKK